MNKSTEGIKNLAVALVKFQSEMQAVKKGAVNPFFRSAYADLPSIIEAIREPLSKNGLAFSQFPSGEHGLTTVLMHESGEYLEDTFYVTPVDAKPQSLGSAITYARRYALGAVLGISTEVDDDGNEASKPAQRASAPVQPKAAPAVAKPAIEPNWAKDPADDDQMARIKELASNLKLTKKDQLQIRARLGVSPDATGLTYGQAEGYIMELLNRDSQQIAGEIFPDAKLPTIQQE